VHSIIEGPIEASEKNLAALTCIASSARRSGLSNRINMKQSERLALQVKLILTQEDFVVLGATGSCLDT
jgi:hypothetical protein